MGSWAIAAQCYIKPHVGKCTFEILQSYSVQVSLWLQTQPVDLLTKEEKLFRCFMLPELTSWHIVRYINDVLFTI